MDQKIILERILLERILDEYRSKDSCLDNTINVLEKLLNQWQSIKGIYISDQPVRASKLEPIFQRRLATIPKEDSSSTLDERMQYRGLRIATGQFVDYLKSNPSANIVTVIFNCDRFHYEVKCGILGEQIRVICVLKGKSILEDLLKDHI